ncbi:hypothetical protein QE394_003954 [Arthrobacter sp. SORGH_AS 212]|uniref:hypothetical protein n=1 Tax=Pseudarthrobacter sp. SORGH_AS 212 TaxID=3041777 RepID=UPI002785BAC4|nr:hypothetical protein [Arthrobacter sp. SORGH_AS_0212]
MVKSRSAFSKILLILVVSILSAMSMSCSPTATPTREDIIGTWTYAANDSTYKTQALNGTLVFHEDGTFQLDRIPAKVVSFIGPDVPTSEHGTWTIVKEARGIDKPFVDITTSGSEVLNGKWRGEFLVEGNGNSRQLVSIIGDRDANMNYVLRRH